MPTSKPLHVNVVFYYLNDIGNTHGVSITIRSNLDIFRGFAPSDSLRVISLKSAAPARIWREMIAEVLHLPIVNVIIESVQHERNAKVKR